MVPVDEIPEAERGEEGIATAGARAGAGVSGADEEVPEH
jgi:hypothetical protein